MKKFTSLSIAKIIGIFMLTIGIITISQGCSDDSSSSNNTPVCGMSFTLNDSAWCGNSYYTLTGTSLTVVGASSGVGTASVTVDNYTGVGEYNTRVYASYTITSANETYIEEVASLKVTKDENNTIEGTFTFTVHSTSDNTKKITVTNGKFSAKKQA